MKILQVIPYFCFGGAETMCENLTYALRDLGDDVVVVSLFDERTEISSRMEAAGVCIRYLSKKPGLDMSVVPSCVYTTPEIASVGLTEENAKANGIVVKSGKYLTGANGKCLIEGTESGYVKLVTDKENGRILGAQLVCPRATDMVGELTLAIQKGLTAADLSEVIHPHPTFSEMLFGAAEGLRPE